MSPQQFTNRPAAVRFLILTNLAPSVSFTTHAGNPVAVLRLRDDRTIRAHGSGGIVRAANDLAAGRWLSPLYGPSGEVPAEYCAQYSEQNP